MNNLNLIIGEDKELVNFYLYEIVKKIDIDDDDKINYDLNISMLSDILDEASMISLFSNKKLIIGNNFSIDKLTDNDLDYLNRYLNNLNKDVYIILIANKIDTRLKKYNLFKENFNVKDVSKVNNKDSIYDYIKNYIHSHNYKIDSMNIDYLQEKLGNDINNINLELDKIFLYLDKDKYIDRETIDLLITDGIDNIIYEFTNATLDKDYDKIVKMYNDFKKENIGLDYLIVSLSNSYRQALIIKILHNQGKSNLEISKIINKKEFYVKKMLERLYKYTESELANYLDNLFIIDKSIKTGKSNFDILELFLIK